MRAVGGESWRDAVGGELGAGGKAGGDPARPLKNGRRVRD